MNLIKCDFCGRVFPSAYLNKLKLYGSAMKDEVELDADVCDDCAKDLYKTINLIEYRRK